MCFLGSVLVGRDQQGVITSPLLFVSSIAACTVLPWTSPRFALAMTGYQVPLDRVWVGGALAGLVLASAQSHN